MWTCEESDMRDVIESYYLHDNSTFMLKPWGHCLSQISLSVFTMYVVLCPIRSIYFLLQAHNDHRTMFLLDLSTGEFIVQYLNRVTALKLLCFALLFYFFICLFSLQPNSYASTGSWFFLFPHNCLFFLNLIAVLWCQ